MKIKAEMSQQVKLSEKVLPSIAQIDLYNTAKMYEESYNDINIG